MKKTIITLAAVIFSILAVAFTVFTQRTQTDQQEIIVTPNSIVQEERELSKEQSTDSQDNRNTQEQSEDPTPEKDPALTEEKKSAFYITNQDCYNECENFTLNSSGWRYCANRCDILPVQASEGECDIKTGLSKDYCLRDSAINNNSPQTCDTITDRGISEQCTNKIIESLVDGF